MKQSEESRQEEAKEDYNTPEWIEKQEQFKRDYANESVKQELQSLRDQLAAKEKVIDLCRNDLNRLMKNIADDDKELAELREQLREREEKRSKDSDYQEALVKIKELKEALRDSNEACESVLRLKGLIGYVQPVKPEHEGEAMAISVMLSKLKTAIDKARKLL